MGSRESSRNGFVWVVALAAVCMLGHTTAMPTITHPLETEVSVPISSLPPGPNSLCFSLPANTRQHDSRCLVSFLKSVEAMLVRSIKVVQGDKKSGEEEERDRGVAHEVVADLIRRVGEEDKNHGPLSDAFVKEILIMADILSDRDSAFSVIYPDYISRGADALAIVSQLQSDEDNPITTRPSLTVPLGIPQFSTSGDVAPLLEEGKVEEEQRDYLGEARKAGTFAELVNPNGCEENDERPECQRSFMEKDPRFEERKRWQVRPTRAYSHQPFEKAMEALERVNNANSASKQGEKNTNNGGGETAKGGAGTPVLALHGTAAVDGEKEAKKEKGSVLVRTTSFPIRGGVPAKE